MFNWLIFDLNYSKKEFINRPLILYGFRFETLFFVYCLEPKSCDTWFNFFVALIFGKENMSLQPQVKIEVISKYQKQPGDTASPEVQVALISTRLEQLKDHFAKNPKDHHSRRGLLKLVGRRKRLLKYLDRTSHASYKNLISELGIRK